MTANGKLQFLRKRSQARHWHDVREKRRQRTVLLLKKMQGQLAGAAQKTREKKAVAAIAHTAVTTPSKIKYSIIT